MESKSLAPRTLTPLSLVSTPGFESALPAIASACEVGMDYVRLMTSAIQRPLRRVPENDRAMLVAAAITAVARDYGTSLLPHHILEECVKMTIDKFSALCVDEIREAYRQFATGELGTGKEAESYRGEFNARNYGAIIGMYAQKRRAVVAAITQEAHDRQLAQEIDKRIARQKAEFALQFPADVNALIKKPDTNWQDVPGWWYDTLEKYGCISVPAEEKREIFAQAKQVAAAELYERRSSAGALELASLQNDITNLLTGADVSRAQRIAKKMCVFDYIIVAYAIEWKTFVLPELPAATDEDLPF